MNTLAICPESYVYYMHARSLVCQALTITGVIMYVALMLTSISASHYIEWV